MDKGNIFMMIAVILLGLQDIISATVTYSKANFTRLGHLCYNEATHSLPPVTNGADLAIRLLTGVRDKRMCAVECAFVPSCAAYQHRPTDNICLLAAACEFWAKWTSPGGDCDTELSEPRNADCTIPQWVYNYNVSVMYNFRRGLSNIMNITRHKLSITGTGLTYDVGGVSPHATSYLVMDISQAREITDHLQYQRVWTMWSRLKRNANNQYTPILQSMNSGNLYEVIRFILNYDKVMLRLWDNVRLIDEVSTPVITSNFSHWIDVAIAFNGTSFTIILDGQIVTGRTQNDNNEFIAGYYNDDRVTIGQYSNEKLDGTMACLGMALAYLNVTQLGNLYDNYCT